MGIPGRSEGGGARSAGRGPSAPGSETPRGWGPLPPPQHVRVGGNPGRASPLPLPRRLKQRSPGARPGQGGAAHRARVRRAPGLGARRPGWPLADFGPATWGYWSSSRSRGGGQSPLEEGSQGARPRGQSAAGAAAASPPRSGLVWSGPARPALQSPRERYKVEKGGCEKGGGVRRPIGHAPA